MRMTCEEALLRISGQLDGELTQEEQAQLQNHLERCPQCWELMQTLLMTDEQLRLADEELPADLHSRIMDAVAKEIPKKKKRRTFRFGTLVAAAAVALLVGIGSLTAPKQQMDVPAEASVMTARTVSSAAQTAVYEKESSMTWEEMAAAAQSVADARGAEVALLHQMVPELEDCLCEPQTDGSMLYTLSDAESARSLCQSYSAVLYMPAQPDEAAALSYAMVIE